MLFGSDWSCVPLLRTTPSAWAPSILYRVCKEEHGCELKLRIQQKLWNGDTEIIILLKLYSVLRPNLFYFLLESAESAGCQDGKELYSIVKGWRQGAVQHCQGMSRRKGTVQYLRRLPFQPGFVLRRDVKKRTEKPA